ncbi:MAG: hypothetical protein OSJ60_09215 [Lachnospiraceae bacterium]|jgi:flagellar biosynthesis/type III secretory pathway M-ring protein FliF/YscJ|nr:hypothetical protein C819_03889 [Lachnospiraceae bacterium 10-1]MCX4351806.1 hypothetical protein [Lachnospiraceae bacterium]
MKKSKLFAPFLMLLAGAVTSFMMYHFKYTMNQTLIIVAVVLFAFYLAGFFIEKKITSFIDQIKEAEENEGEVIEKEGPGAGEEETVVESTKKEADDKA